MLSRNQCIIVGVAAVVVVAGVTWQVTSETPVPRPSIKDVAPPEILAALNAAKPALAAAVSAPAVDKTEVIFERTGAHTLQVRVTNKGKEPFAIRCKAGDVLDGERSQSVVLLKSFEADVQPGETKVQDLPVVATKSANPGDHGRFTSSSKQQANLAPLIHYFESNPTTPIGAVQAAALAITEDAPVDLFARFPRSGDPVATPVENFKVDTVELVAAIQLLRDIGIESSKLASDPQLKIEAMIDPQAHAGAMKYYGIEAEAEWAYWRHQLLEGDPGTRHYALYGIARFYPDVALQMMPKWALEQRTAPHYRRAAIGALALTRRTEAGDILRTLERDLAQESELVQKVNPALRYLEQTANDAL
jgi:hypothetical protein